MLQYGRYAVCSSKKVGCMEPFEPPRSTPGFILANGPVRLLRPGTYFHDTIHFSLLNRATILFD